MLRCGGYSLASATKCETSWRLNVFDDGNDGVARSGNAIMGSVFGLCGKKITTEFCQRSRRHRWSRETHPNQPYRLDSIAHFITPLINMPAHLVFKIAFVSNVAENASPYWGRPRVRLDCSSSCHQRLAHQIPDQCWAKCPLTSGLCPQNHENRPNQTNGPVTS